MNSDFVGGALLVDKQQGVTSHDVVGKIRKLYGTRKVGHTGTLDPMATGLLLVLIGGSVKASERLTDHGKAYVAEMKLGITTDTADLTGSVTSSCDVIPDKSDVIAAAKSFVGVYMQTPPMYSAIKRGGKKLYEYAREGKTVEVEARPVVIFSLDISGDGDTYVMRVACSKGTYIRTLCEDIGKKLGCGAAMSALRRVALGDFSVEDAVTTDALEAMSEGQRLSRLIPPEKIFAHYPSVTLSDFYAKLCVNGCEIYQKKIKTDFSVGASVRVYSQNGFLGIGNVGEYPDGTAIKLVTRFS